MNKKYIILGIVFSALMITTSCVNDLDIEPKDPNIILSGNLTKDDLKQVLGKIYGSFILAGQGSNGGADIAAEDENFYTTSRCLWNMQELTTDEAICAWTDNGIPDLNVNAWTPSNLFVKAMYQRLSLSITYANDFIVLTKGSDDPEIMQYRAEARFLRALAYYYHMDLFGNPPFTTEADGVGKYFPKQIKRADLFNWVTTELKDIEDELGEPGFSYPQADKAAAWMLLAKLYQNAEVYTGTAKWDSCIIYSEKVINNGTYSLATDYRQNFSADNDGNSNPEMIFALEQDGINTQGAVGTTFIIKSSSESTYLRTEEYHGLTSNTNWEGNRTGLTFLNTMIDTLAIYGGAIDPLDTIFAQSNDNRVFLKTLYQNDIPSPSSKMRNGIGVYKFTARNHDGSQAANYSPAFASTDFPIFRFADAYMMRAEALLNLNDAGSAVLDVNRIRERAYGDASGNITAVELTDQFLLDELAREFYYEGRRRSDLIRFGKFTTGYNWEWKGGVKDGIDIPDYRELFPIPGDEISSNPNMIQNPGY